MVHFIYQEIIIFTNKNEQLSNIIKNICYTNFKIIELTDINSISSSVFLEQVPIKESRNETIKIIVKVRIQIVLLCLRMKLQTS